HGVFLAACGFEYHGPKGHLGFAPRLTPDSFRAPFTAAEGWGTISQKRDGNRQQERIEVRWGSLRIKTLAFEVTEGWRIGTASVSATGRVVESTHTQEGQRIMIRLAREAKLSEGEALEVELRRTSVVP